MFFRQYYLACLSHASYLIGDTTTGRAVVVDPQRDIDQYLADADANGLTIDLVLETHFHADFLSGHLEMAAATGATIGYGAAAAGRAEFPIQTFADGDRIELGDVVLLVRETPGHTPESISIAICPEGDTVEPGDTETRAGGMFAAIPQEVTVELPDETIADLTKRLRRAEGQVRGVQQMLAEGRDCRDTLTQLSAATKALEQVAFMLVAAGLTWCVSEPEKAAAEGYALSDVQKMFMKLA